MKNTNKSLKIGIVLYPTFGGSGVLATELGKKLAARGHHIHFIASAQPARLDGYHQNIFFHEVHVPSYPLFEFTPYEVALTSHLVHVAQSAQLDVIHAHYAIPHASAAVLARQILADKGIRVPVVTTLHGTDITLVGRDRSYEPVISYAINQSDAVTAVSNYLKTETLNHFHVKSEIEVVYNFIDSTEVTLKPDECIKRFAAPNDELLITHISNFRPVKRVMDVIQTFARVQERVAARLLMVGDGPLRQEAENLSAQLGIRDKVLFIGKSKDTTRLLACSDLFILPSESESFGLSALEAMACGVPVIATDTGGMPEVQIHGETGFLCPIGDVECMANHAVELLSNPELRARFGQNARLRANNFRSDMIVPQYEALYRKVLDFKA
jgi:L-malate glycosyltransferase